MIWLSTSLFCCKREWNKLFSTGIIPFLADLKTNSLLNAYTIEINYLCGENIRLLLLTAKINANRLAKHTDVYFKNYFVSTNLYTPEIKLPVNGIFLPLRTNSIHYGLYPAYNITRNERKNYSFSIKLSQIILKALKEDEVDEESVLTFSLYLKIGLIKAIKLIEPGFAPEYVDNKLIEGNILKRQFEGSREIIGEIVRDVMVTGDEAEIPEWLVKWVAICKVEIKKHKNIKGKTIYQNMVMVIYKHLAITPKMDSILNYFIEQVDFTRHNT